MHQAFEVLSTRVEARSPIDVDGTQFTLHLTEIREADEHTVGVIVEAHSDAELHTGEFHRRRERLDDPGSLARAIVATMERVIRGDLPPGAREVV
jgi:hypothetical protein